MFLTKSNSKASLDCTQWRLHDKDLRIELGTHLSDLVHIVSEALDYEFFS